MTLQDALNIKDRKGMELFSKDQASLITAGQVKKIVDEYGVCFLSFNVTGHNFNNILINEVAADVRKLARDNIIFERNWTNSCRFEGVFLKNI